MVWHGMIYSGIIESNTMVCLRTNYHPEKGLWSISYIVAIRPQPFGSFDPEGWAHASSTGSEVPKQSAFRVFALGIVF